MRLEERNKMLRKVKEFDSLTSDLDKLKKFKEEVILSSTGVIRVELFGTINGGIKEVPNTNELGKRIQQLIVEEVNRDIEKITKEIEQL